MLFSFQCSTIDGDQVYGRGHYGVVFFAYHALNSYSYRGGSGYGCHGDVPFVVVPGIFGLFLENCKDCGHHQVVYELGFTLLRLFGLCGLFSHPSLFFGGLIKRFASPFGMRGVLPRGDCIFG